MAQLGPAHMDFAYDGYQQLKLAGSGDKGLDEMRRDIGAQFNRRRRPALTPEPVPAG